jgi:hypothetical protein
MSVNITTTTNDVTINNANRTISVTDNNQSTTVKITQPVTNTIQVATQGPQGITGPQGPSGSAFPYTGSAIISGSLTVTGSVNATSFTGSLLGRATNATVADTANIANELSLLGSGTKVITPTNSDIIIEYPATTYIGGIFYIRVENQTNYASKLYTLTTFNSSTAVTASYTPTFELPGTNGENTNDFVLSITINSSVTLNGTNNSSEDTYNVNYYRLSYLSTPS